MKYISRQYGNLRTKKRASFYQYYGKQQKGYVSLSEFVSSHFSHEVEVRSIKQGLYLPSFKKRGIKIDGKCVVITRGLSQALFLHKEKSVLGNLETSAKIYERIAQGEQVSKREEREVFAFSKLLDGFEQQLDSSTNSLPLNLIHTENYRTLEGLSHYIAKVKGNFAIHLITSNHIVAIYRVGNNYVYFDSNTAFVSGLKSVDQLIEILEKGVKSAGYKVEERGFFVEYFDVDKANDLLSANDTQVLAKEIKTECQLLAEQDKELGLIKINDQELSRVQLYDLGTKISIEGSIPLLINADMKLSSKKFQDYLDKKEVSITAKEYLENLKGMEEIVQATRLLPFEGSSREIEEAEQTRKPGNIRISFERINKVTALQNISVNNSTANTLCSNASRTEDKLPGAVDKADNKLVAYLNYVTVENQLQRSMSF